MLPHTQLKRDDQPTLAVHLSIPRLHRHQPQQQLHPWECARFKPQCPHGGSQTVPPTCPCTHRPSPQTGQRHRPKCGKIWHILPTPHQLCPRCSLLSCLGSLSSARLCRCNARLQHPRSQREPRQADVAPALDLCYSLPSAQRKQARLRR